ncbi:MAG TPA: hypothetical protein VFF06_05645 [Polyangia bacterium]|nr:hypothetical protein [Polyangia bacterium]
MRNRLLLAALALASVAAGTSARSYRNEALHVRGFEPPSGWVLAPQGSYPRLLASYSHREGGRITLSAQRIAPGTTALKLAESSRAPLERQGFAALVIAADGARARLEATLDGGKRFARQLYLTDGGVGFVVTLIAPRAAESTMVRDYEEALRTLQVGAGAESIVR